jgi:hypothetical protein
LSQKLDFILFLSQDCERQGTTASISDLPQHGDAVTEDNLLYDLRFLFRETIYFNQSFPDIKYFTPRLLLFL